MPYMRDIEARADGRNTIMTKITEAQLAKGYEQTKTALSLAQAHARVIAGLPIITEETRDAYGHSVFKYFLPDFSS